MANLVKSRVVEFVLSVARHWGTLVTGGFIIGLIGTWQGMGHAVSSWVYGTVATVAFLVAAFRAWNEQDDASIRKESTKGSLHVVWQPQQCMWGLGKIGNVPAMQIIASGLFTNSHPKITLLLTQAYLDGTKPSHGLFEPIEVPTLHSIGGEVTTFVQPVIRQIKEPYIGHMIFIDQFNQQHKVHVELRPLGSPDQPIATVSAEEKRQKD